MKRALFHVVLFLQMTLLMSCKQQPEHNLVRHYERWSLEEINEWYDRQDWLVGVNYIPSNKVNQIDMWQASSFDADIMDKELAMAEELGFNEIGRASCRERV